MGNTCLVNCTCKHNFQDERYGRGVRVANLTKDNKARCTVCGTTKDRKIKEDA